jgi:cell division protein FtsB
MRETLFSFFVDVACCSDYKEENGMKEKLQKAGYAALAVLLGGYAVVHLTGSQGIPALLEKRKQIRALQEENRGIRHEIEEKRVYLNDLASSPEAQKRLVRERLHYVEDGTVDFKTPSDVPPPKN